MLSPAAAVLHGSVHPVHLLRRLKEEFFPESSLLACALLADPPKADIPPRLKVKSFKYEA